MKIDNLWPLMVNMPDWAGFRLHYLTLYSMVIGTEARSVLEFGAGYSTQVILCAIADGPCKDGMLLTIDKRGPERTCKAIPKELANRHTYLQGEFMDCKEEINRRVFDVCLHDGSHDVPSVKDELNVIIPRMKQNGILLIHDTWGGEAYGLDNFLLNPRLLQNMPGDLEYMTLPYGGGLTLARVRADYGHGRIKTTWTKAGFGTAK